MLFKQETMSIEEKIEKAFKNTNFGASKPLDLIIDAIRKVAQGYANGYTIKCICEELGFIREYDDHLFLTKDGLDFYCSQQFKKDIESLTDEMIWREFTTNHPDENERRTDLKQVRAAKWAKQYLLNLFKP